MAQERLHPYDQDQVIREIIPGGHEPRQYILYPNEVSLRAVQWLERRRFVPDWFVSLVDDGMPMDGSPFDRDYSVEDLASAEEEELTHAA